MSAEEFKNEVEQDIHKKNKLYETLIAFGVLLVALGLIGYGIWAYLSVSETPDGASSLIYKKNTGEETSSATKPTTDADKVVKDFYTWYLAQTGNMSAKYKTSEALTTEFKAKLDTAYVTATADQILLAQNTPDSFTVDAPTVSGSTATVVVHTIFGTTDRQLTVSLKIVDSAWKIDGITEKK